MITLEDYLLRSDNVSRMISIDFEQYFTEGITSIIRGLTSLGEVKEAAVFGSRKGMTTVYVDISGAVGEEGSIIGVTLVDMHSEDAADKDFRKLDMRQKQDRVAYQALQNYAVRGWRPGVGCGMYMVAGYCSRGDIYRIRGADDILRVQIQLWDMGTEDLRKCREMDDRQYSSDIKKLEEGIRCLESSLAVQEAEVIAVSYGPFVGWEQDDLLKKKRKLEFK